MHRVVDVKPLSGYLLHIVFSDGVEKTIAVKPYLGKGISRPLLDESFFQQVSVESGGGIYWPNGFDFCPEFLYEEVPDVSVEPA